jgi:hypothetical protein
LAGGERHGVDDLGVVEPKTKVVVPDAASIAAVIAGGLEKGTPIDTKKRIAEIQEQLEAVARAKTQAAETVTPGAAGAATTIVRAGRISGRSTGYRLLR